MKNQTNLTRRLECYSQAAGAIRAVRRGLNRRGVRYSAAAAAGAALVGASPADAALITSPLQGQMFSVDSNSDFVNLDIDGDTVADDIYMRLSATTFRSSQTNSFSLYGPLLAAQASVTFRTQLNRLFNYISTSTSETSFFSTTLTRTAAFQFRAGTNTSGFLNAGWLQAVIQFQPGLTKVTFPTVVYNTTPGAPIHVGDVPGVPEPASIGLMGLGLLALGARGLREQRRRKEKQTTSI